MQPAKLIEAFARACAGEGSELDTRMFALWMVVEAAEHYCASLHAEDVKERLNADIGKVRVLWGLLNTCMHNVPPEILARATGAASAPVMPDDIVF